MRRLARLHAQGVFAERSAGQGADRIRRVRQSDLGVPRTRHARVGLDQRHRLGRLGFVGQPAPPTAGAALLMSNTLRLTQELIARRSVSPADGGCQALMIDRLAALGFTVESLRFGPVDNFWAKRGSGGPVFCFAGHTDVVPSGPLDEWRSDPFEPVIRDGVLYGRGAADMKSGFAGLVTANEEFIRQ